MKKLISLFALLSLVFCLASCGKSNFTLDTDELVDKIENYDLFLDTLAPITENALSSVVGLSTDGIESWTYEIGTGATGEEFGVITCKTEDDAKTIKSELEERQQSLYDTYESYSPDSLPRISDAVLEQKGVYVIFISCDNDDVAQTLIDGYLD